MQKKYSILLQKFKEDPFFQFTELVLSKENPFGTLVVLSVKRFIKDLENKKLIFDYEEGKRIVRFASICNHWKGTFKGKPIIFEPHQQFYIIQQFGWFLRSGKRRFNTCYKEVARKNGKTTEEAVKAIWFLCKDGVNGAQVYVGAPKEDLSKILVTDAAKIIEESPALRNRFKIYYNREHARRVIYPANSAYLAPLGRDSKKDDGFDPQAGIIDEYHLHDNDGILNVIESGMGSRENPMMDIITTAGYNKEGPCFRFRKHCIDILKGIKVDDSLLVLIFSLDKKDDWKNKQVYIKANPNLGVSVNDDFLKTRRKKAINEGGTKEVDFKTKNLNFWTDAADVWLQDETWVKSGSNPSKHQSWFIGVDLAATQDINAVVLFSSPDKKGYHSIKPYFFVPEEKVKMLSADGIVTYRDWAKEGHLIVTPGNVADHNAIKYKIEKICSKKEVEMIEFDRWNAHKLATELSEEGLPVEYYGQGFKDQNPSCKMLEKLVLEKKLRHGNNPVLRWMNSNVMLRMDPAGNIKMDKAASGNKIDGMAALSNAIGGYLTWVANGGLAAKPSITTW